MNNQKYYQAVGRRKTATATVRLYPGESGFIVNEKPLEEYFKVKECVIKAKEALEKVNLLENFKVIAKVRGGGFSAQSEAIRLGTARALVLYNPDLKKILKDAGFLTRDPRERERKKPGLKRARRAPQWQKR